MMYARAINGKIAADVLAAVCRARSRNFEAARLRARLDAWSAGYLV